MVEKIGQGLLEVFRKIQQERNIINTQEQSSNKKNEKEISLNDRIIEENIAVLNRMSVVNSVNTLDEAINILNKIHKQVMHPEILNNIDDYYIFDPARTGNSLLE